MCCVHHTVGIVDVDNFPYKFAGVSLGRVRLRLSLSTEMDRLEMTYLEHLPLVTYL